MNIWPGAQPTPTTLCASIFEPLAAQSKNESLRLRRPFDHHSLCIAMIGSTREARQVGRRDAPSARRETQAEKLNMSRGFINKLENKPVKNTAPKTPINEPRVVRITLPRKTLARHGRVSIHRIQDQISLTISLCHEPVGLAASYIDDCWRAFPPFRRRSRQQ